jgi:hypothetical protein
MRDEGYNEILKELNVKTNEDKLLSKDFITMEFIRLSATHMDEIAKHKQESEHGESPQIKRLYFDKDNKLTLSAKDAINRYAICGLIAENNHRLLNEVKSLLSRL